MIYFYLAMCYITFMNSTGLVSGSVESHMNRGQRNVRKRIIKKLAPGATSQELRDLAIRLCNQYNYNPLESLIKLRTVGIEFDDPEKPGEKITVVAVDPELCFKIDKEILPYIMPKLKSLEVTGDFEGDLTVNINKFEIKGE